MKERERFKVKEYGGDYCDFEESSEVTDAFELLNPDDYPEEQRSLVEEFNRRAQLGNQRHRIAMYRAEMFEKGFNAGMYICTFDHDENMTSFVFTDETRRLLGYDGLDDLPNEFESWVKTLLPEQREAMIPIFWNTVKNHRALPDISHAEYPMVRKDGRIIWVTGAGRFICREDGSLEIYMGCYRDVTAEHEKDDYLHVIEGIGKVFNFSLYIDMTTQKYKIVSTNEYVEKIEKVENAFQFLRDNVNSSVHPDYRDELNAWFQPEVISALLKEKDTTSKDFYSKEADSWFRGIFMVGDRNKDGSLNHIIYGCQEITEEKKREQEQQAQLVAEQKEKEREHDIVDALSESYLNVYVINTAEKLVEILKLNGYVTRGLSKEKTGPYPYEATCKAYITNRVYREDQNMVTRCMSLENLLVQLKEKKEYEFTYRVPEDGEISYYQGKYVAIDGGNIVCGFQNINAIVKKEREQKEELERLNESLSKQIDVIGGLSNAYVASYSANLDTGEFHELKQIPGIHDAIKNCTTIQEAFDRFIPLGVTEEDQQRMKEFTDISTLPERMKESDVIYFEYRGRVTGSWNRASWIVAKRDENKRVYGVLYVVEEITGVVLERKHHEEELKLARDQAEAANRAKTSFLFNMSHDIRTPMNAIIGFTDLIEKHYDEKEKCMEYIHKTQEANKLLLSLINNVLEMARIESGKEHLDETVCQSGTVTREIISIFEDQIRQKNLNLISKVDIHTPYMMADQPKLREICLNILSNAVKYTPSGGSIHIEMIELPCEKKGYARLRGVCADTGIGMSKEFLPHLFEEFTREQTATESRQQGTGLGMPIVKKLIDLMGGTIEVESELGKGSTFTVTLDLRIAENEPEQEDKNQNAVTQASFKGKRILLAEDNDFNAEIAIEILTDAGFEVDRAADGIICIDMLQKAECHYYDLILMDIQMPNMDGYKATQLIRSMKDSCRSQIPIIAMTANAFEEDKKNAFAVGMNGHLAKPIKIPQLMEMLSEILK